LRSPIEKEVIEMSEEEEMRRVDETHVEQRSVTGAIITGAAAGGANALVTQGLNALKKPKDNKPKK
jgi:hypothetical protein